MDTKHFEITLIENKATSNFILDRILNSINTYLLRNKGSVSDFTLIKDIVERNCDSVNDEIESLIPIPLYLGLMGTMLGIIIGLFFIPSISNFTNPKFEIGQKVKIESTRESVEIIKVLPDDEYTVINGNGNQYKVNSSELSQSVGIDILLGGVKIAMISSFIGLLLTVIASGYLYKGSKSRLDRGKNEFYTFVQTELLPVIAKDTTSVIRTLERNLSQFNNDFGKNSLTFNQSFAGFIGSIGELKTISIDFKQLLKEIQNLNLLKLTKVNVDLLERINLNASKLGQFNKYLEQIDAFVANSLELNNSLTQQLNRTHSIEAIANTIKSSLDQNEKIMSFLESGIMEINSRKQMFADAIIDIDEQLRKSLTALEEHTKESINSIRNITIHEENLLEKLLKEDRGNLDKLKNLDSVKQSLASMITISESQDKLLGTLNQSIQDLRSDMKKKREVISLPDPIKYLGYVFIGTGAIVGIGFILYVLVTQVVKLIQML